jgi:hypothetical protein
LSLSQGILPEQPTNSAVELEDIAIRERDMHMAKRAAKHASKRTAESLVDTHQKEINKKKKVFFVLFFLFHDVCCTQCFTIIMYIQSLLSHLILFMIPCNR